MATPSKQIEGILKRSPAVKQALASNFDVFSQPTAIVTLQVQRMDRQFLDGKIMCGESLKAALIIASSARNAHVDVTCSIFLLGNKNREILSAHDFSQKELCLPDHVTWDGKSRRDRIPLSGLLRTVQVMEYDKDAKIIKREL